MIPEPVHWRGTREVNHCLVQPFGSHWCHYTSESESEGEGGGESVRNMVW